MRKSLRGLLTAALLLTGLALLGAPASANKAAAKGNSNVVDNAKFFSEDVVKKARSRVNEIRDDFGQGLWIETIAKADSKDAVKDMAIKKYNEHKVGGVLVLICKEPEYLFVEAGKETSKRAFTPANRERLIQIFGSNFKDQKFDRGLEEGIDYVGRTFETNIGKVSTQSGAAGSTRTTASKGDSFLSKYGGWICIGLVALLGLWLVVGLVRAFTRPSAPVGGPGYGAGGGPGYGGGGGGGGGGFMSSMLGGMFGAAAGMWMYDSFFRSSPPVGGGMTPSAYGGDAGAAPDNSAGPGGGGDWGGGGAATGGGGDWGGGQADGGGGGGDWGAGGDAGGGGGDW